MNGPRYDRHQCELGERRVNTSHSHNPCDNYHHQAPLGQHFYNNNCTNQDMLQRQQRWTNQRGNDGMQRHQQPVGFVSPAGHKHQRHQHANNNSTQRPTGHQEAYPFVGVSPSAQHHNSLPIMLTCTTAAPGGAATGAHEGEGEDSAEDDLHGPWHVPYSDSYDDFETPMDVNDITITALETLRPVTLIVLGPPSHRDTLMWTNIAPQTDSQNYIDNINTIELTDPSPCAWDLCL
eukprot:jgi/Tetstr1/421617/TSEL_012558.t1